MVLANRLVEAWVNGPDPNAPLSDQTKITTELQNWLAFSQPYLSLPACTALQNDLSSYMDVAQLYNSKALELTGSYMQLQTATARVSM